MTTTTLTPTDERKKVDPFDLDDIATEIRCLSSNVYIVSKVVAPKELEEIDTPSEKTVEEVFYSIMMQLEHVADRLEAFTNCLMQEQKTTATPTDESKDCR